MKPQVEWKNAHEMAEFAEVLGITTEMIMAVNMTSDQTQKQLEYLVLYTPDWPGDETIWSVFMRRDGDGILRLSSVKTKRAGLWEKIKDSIEDGLQNEDPSYWITGDDA